MQTDKGRIRWDQCIGDKGTSIQRIVELREGRTVLQQQRQQQRQTTHSDGPGVASCSGERDRVWNRKGQSRVVPTGSSSSSVLHPPAPHPRRKPLAQATSPRPPPLLMQLGEPRPSSVLAQAGDWQPRSLMDPGPSSSSSSSSSAPPPSSSFLPSTSLSQRRRSSAAHAPPPAPPPTQPIPSVPIIDTTPPDSLDRLADYDDGATYNGIAAYSPFVRPAVSPGLAAVAAFSQARLAAASQPAPPAPYYHNGLDSPPHHP
ncbi:hypothetical protein HETIRDRAFT_99815, partial [Heterobasidion irregulare TC 32-1]